MPAIKHDGREYVLKTIKLKCLKCNTFCETSKPYPNIAQCECGHARVDGGISIGANMYGNPWAMEDYSIYRTEDNPKVQLPQVLVTRDHDKVREAMLDSYRKHGMPQKDIDEIMSGR
jgi:hypothetical protein